MQSLDEQQAPENDLFIALGDEEAERIKKELVGKYGRQVLDHVTIIVIVPPRRAEPEVKLHIPPGRM